MRLAALALLIPLAACGTPSADTADALTGGLKAAEQTATLYVQLPLCPTPTPCRKPGVATQIGAVDAEANALLVKYKAGQAKAADVSAAIAKLVALFAAK